MRKTFGMLALGLCLGLTGCLQEAAAPKVPTTGQPGPLKPPKRAVWDEDLSYESADLTLAKVGLGPSHDQVPDHRLKFLIPRAYFWSKPYRDKVWTTIYSLNILYDRMEPYGYVSTHRVVEKKEQIRTGVKLEKKSYTKHSIDDIQRREKYIKEASSDHPSFTYYRYQILSDHLEDFFFPTDKAYTDSLYYECIPPERRPVPRCIGHTKLDLPQLHGESELVIEYEFDRSLLADWKALDTKVKTLIRSFVVDDWPAGTPTLEE